MTDAETTSSELPKETGWIIEKYTEKHRILPVAAMACAEDRKAGRRRDEVAWVADLW